MHTTRSNGSSIWPYVIAGSAIGGAIGYLAVSESGRKIRRSMTHPDELADNIDEARNFMEEKTRLVTDRVHRLVDKARQGIEEGQRAYREAADEFRLRARRVESKNEEITSGVHQTVDKMSRTAVSVEHSVLDPVCELGALYRGVQEGVRAMLGRKNEPVRIPSDQRWD